MIFDRFQQQVTNLVYKFATLPVDVLENQFKNLGQNHNQYHTSMGSNNLLEGMLDQLNIEYRYDNCGYNEIRILSYYESRTFDIDYLFNVLQGIDVFDVDELTFWQTL